MREPKRASVFAAFLLVALVLAVLAPWRYPLSADGLAVFRTAAALAFEGTFRLPPPPAGAGLNPLAGVPAPGGGFVAIYAPLGPLWRSLVLTVSQALPPGVVRGRTVDLVFGLAAILVAAAAVIPLARLLRYGGVPRRVAPLLAAALLVCTFLGPLGVGDFQEPSLVLLACLALERALWARRRRGSERRRALVAAAGSLGLALLAKATAGVFLPALCLAALPRRGPSRSARALVRDALTVAIGLAPGVALLLLLDQLRYGSPFEFGYSAPHLALLEQRIGLSWSLLRLTLLPNRGLLWFAPPLVLALFGIAPVVRRSWRFVDLIASAVGACTALLVNALWWSWEGGMGWGPRLAAPAVGLAAPLIGAGARKHPRLALCLVAGGFLINLPGYLLETGRIYEVVAARPTAPPPVGPVLDHHKVKGVLHPLQRVHYVPSCATWIVAPRVLSEILLHGDGPETGGRRDEDRRDALLFRLVTGRATLPPASDVGRTLLEEAIVTPGEQVDRQERFAHLAIDFGAPYVDARSFASYVALRRGKPDEAIRLCREGLARDPRRSDLSSNLALAMRMRDESGRKP